MASLKSKKVGSEMVKVISEIIANESRDELLKTVTITACDVANDLSFAKVYYTVLDESKKASTEEALKGAASFIRTKLAERVDIRHTPELKFIYDTSIAYGEHIEKIIDKINEKEKVD